MATEWTLRAAPAGETCCDEHQRVRCGKPALLLLSAGGIGSYHCIDIVFALLATEPTPGAATTAGAAAVHTDLARTRQTRQQLNLPDESTLWLINFLRGSGPAAFDSWAKPHRERFTAAYEAELDRLRARASL